MKELILASASPSRKEILEKIGVPFSVITSNYREDMNLNLPPRQLAIKLSYGKAKDVAKIRPRSIIIAADSFAVYRGNLLGKPHSTENAITMLESLSGNVHSFITGYTILDAASGKIFSEAVVTKVFFRQLTKQEIEHYVAAEDVLEKAGAYALQGLGAALVDKIEGDYSNIMGLPIGRIAKNLPKFGIGVL